MFVAVELLKPILTEMQKTGTSEHLAGADVQRTGGPDSVWMAAENPAQTGGVEPCGNRDQAARDLTVNSQWGVSGLFFGIADGYHHAAVIVVQAHDVILAQVTTRLHLDHFERGFARVVEAVYFAQGDVG
jgi:hypothetical protein